MPFSIVLSRIWGRKRAPATRANSHPQWPHMASTVKPASATISKMQPRLHTSTTIILLVEFSVSTWAGFRPLPSQVYHIHLYIYIYIYIYLYTYTCTSADAAWGFVGGNAIVKAPMLQELWVCGMAGQRCLHRFIGAFGDGQPGEKTCNLPQRNTGIKFI